jgi:hypothetical protein
MINVVDSIIIVHHQTSKVREWGNVARVALPLLCRPNHNAFLLQTSLLFDIKAKKRRAGPEEGGSPSTTRTHVPLMSALPMAPATLEGDGQVTVCAFDGRWTAVVD